ncbi:integrator complex subunit 9 [Ditylenchus destructor]|uniref:Integrator complex subunit 9 n=1 Tax=Ditylenchus destructor TaxID=166010 RepID=A0AAD4NIM2_9BILA|nr:integrator complex subunit 9 [Ditylenchus destructor]
MTAKDSQPGVALIVFIAVLTALVITITFIVCLLIAAWNRRRAERDLEFMDRHLDRSRRVPSIYAASCNRAVNAISPTRVFPSDVPFNTKMEAGPPSYEEALRMSSVHYVSPNNTTNTQIRSNTPFVEAFVLEYFTMDLTPLSWMPNRPSLLLRFADRITILLDCAFDIGSISAFIPYSIVKSAKPVWMKDDRPLDKKFVSVAQNLKMIGDRLFVDSVPEFQVVSLGNVDPSLIDVILVSNWMSLMALPFITEKSNFRGTIYATEPTVQFGRIMSTTY